MPFSLRVSLNYTCCHDLQVHELQAIVKHWFTRFWRKLRFVLVFDTSHFFSLVIQCRNFVRHNFHYYVRSWTNSLLTVWLWIRLFTQPNGNLLPTPHTHTHTPRIVKCNFYCPPIYDTWTIFPRCYTSEIHTIIVLNQFRRGSRKVTNLMRWRVSVWFRTFVAWF